jgi:hypothetical protein
VACALAWLLTAPACAARVGDAAPSLEALAGSVLEAFEQRDAARLRALAITEQEFRDVVYPELPASKPERNLSVEFVWNDLQVKSDAALTASLREHGGRPLTLVGVRFAGDTSQYRSFLVRREAVLTVSDGKSGTETIRLFASIFEQDGRYKVFSYVVD